MKKTVIIYHDNCVDGTVAAAVARKKFPDAHFFPLSHSYTSEDMEPIRAVADGASIFMLDCALGVDELLADGHSIIVLDHHESIGEEMQKRAEADDEK